jgi:glycosyltransferase involved in cell wall biosynthesis
MAASAGAARVPLPGAKRSGLSMFTDRYDSANAGLERSVWRFRHWLTHVRFRARHWRSLVHYRFERVVWLRARSAVRSLTGAKTPHAEATGNPAPRPSAVEELAAPVLADFDEYFPEREDRLTTEEVAQWQYERDVWQKLLSRYDIVQGYGTDVIRPYAAGVRPYVGYEHGTLRDFTMGDDFVSRMCALSYRAADHVFITNGDCLEYAQRLGVTDYTPMIHPLDVDRYRLDQQDEIAALRAAIDADVILLCPLRHDWEIKGTDVHLRALPLIRAAAPARRVKVVLTRWGAQVAESESLLRDLGCADAAHWVETLGRDDLILYMRAADVVLDQIALPHFGATAPQAIAAGTPVVMSYRPNSTAWIVGEPAPILPAFDPAGVAAAVQTALDPQWRGEYAAAAARWTRRWHHPDRIVLDHCRTYRRLLEARNDG